MSDLSGSLAEAWLNGWRSGSGVAQAASPHVSQRARLSGENDRLNELQTAEHAAIRADERERIAKWLDSQDQDYLHAVRAIREDYKP